MLSFHPTIQKIKVMVLGFLKFNHFQGDFLLFAVFAFEMEILETNIKTVLIALAYAVWNLTLHIVLCDLAGVSNNTVAKPHSSRTRSQLWKCSKKSRGIRYDPPVPVTELHNVLSLSHL